MTGRFRPQLASRPLDTVVRRLRLLAALSEAEQQFVRQLGERRERHTSGEELIAEGQATTRDEVRELMSGNLCRCGAYPQIADAVCAVLGAGEARP